MMMMMMMMIEGSSDLSIIGLPNNLLPVGCVHRFSLPADDLVFV
jgi:hypothetical protein